MNNFRGLSVTLFSIFSILFASGALSEETQETTCRLIYKSDFNTQGPCTVSPQGSLLTVDGLLSQDGRRFIAVLDTASNEGMLVSATTVMTLAYGKVGSSTPNTYVWNNGHALVVGSQ